MLKRYYNKMFGKGEYSIKMERIPVEFRSKLNGLKNTARLNGWHSKKVAFIARMHNKRRQLARVSAQKENHDELMKFIEHVEKELSL